MSRSIQVLVVLGIAQAALVAGYLLVEQQRRDVPSFQVESLDSGVPALHVERDGQPVDLPKRPYLVHFWATWCAPCIEELPALLAAATAEDIPLLAVTDEPWPVVHAWFGGTVPLSIVRDPSGTAAKTWRVSGLPDTFVVENGRLVGRMGGPRAWMSAPARSYLREVRQ